jgi:hypothetical protein
MAAKTGTAGDELFNVQFEQGQRRGRRRGWCHGLGRSGALIWKLVIHRVAKLAWGPNGSKPENPGPGPGKGSCPL